MQLWIVSLIADYVFWPPQHTKTGIKTAQSLAETFHAKFRVLLIEKNSHFQHLFAFPRFAVTTKGIDIRKAFIPFNPGTFAACPPGSGKVVQAKVTSIDRQHVRIDRKIALDGSQVDVIPYKYLVSSQTQDPANIPLYSISARFCVSLTEA